MWVYISNVIHLGSTIVKKKEKKKLIFHIKVLGMVKVCNKKEHYLNAEVVKKTLNSSL